MVLLACPALISANSAVAFFFSSLFLAFSFFFSAA